MLTHAVCGVTMVTSSAIIIRPVEKSLAVRVAAMKAEEDAVAPVVEGLLSRYSVSEDCAALVSGILRADANGHIRYFLIKYPRHVVLYEEVADKRLPVDL